jgi:protease secretion system outer membrane protein
VDRLAVAYLQRMLAEDAFLSLHAQVHATVAQRNLMRRRFEQGEGTRTEVAEARANLSLTLVQWADSKNQMMSARDTLEAMTGVPQPLVVRLEDEFSPPPLVPAGLQEWQDKAVSANPDVQAKRYLVEAADALVARSNAGHMPRLDLVASVSNSRNESISSLNQSVNQGAIGLQLNIPIYSGGAVKAAVTQALAEKTKAEAEWLNEKRNLEVEVSRLYQIIQTGSSKLLAYEDVLDASRVALEGTLKGQASGLRTNADVLEAVRKVFQAQRDLAQARYDHIFQRLRLFNKAGVPADSVVSYIDELLSPNRGTP